MADISSYLAAIMAAVYGEDVRGSIHDAIDIINKVGEVVLNTGTAVTGPTSSSTGFYTGSFYINTNTMELWKCIGTDSWQSQGVLKGADGADGNGIVSIVKTSTVGLVDTYTITYDDGGTETYQVTNGQNGSKWYKGTAISGTGTSITGFPGVINDFYLNSVDGYVYTCTKTGGALPPDAAEWDYVMTLTGGGGTSVTVIDNLTSTSSTDALSANQGRVLKGYVDLKANSADLAAVATSGAYSDLTGKPTIPAAANDGTFTVQQNGVTKGSSTADQSGNTSANIVTDEWTASVQVASGAFTFSGLDDTKGWGYDPYFSTDGNSVNKNPTAEVSTISGAGTASMSVSYTTDADEGAFVKLRIVK